MNRPRRTRPTILLVSFLLVVTAACGSEGSGEGSASDLTPFTVVLDWTPNTNHAGVYLAEAEGWYAEAGLDLRIIEPGDAGALQLLVGGQADVAFSAQEELIPARAEGLPVVAIAAVVQHNTSSLLSLAGTGIAGPADLPGHTYGGYGGPLERALVERLTECGGGDPADVEFAEVGDVDYRVGLEQDQYDFVWIFDGWDKVRLAELEDVDVATIPFAEHQDCIPDWYTPMIATTEAAIADGGDSDALARFTSVTRRGYQEAMADPAAAASALIEAVPELDPELVGRSAEYLATRYSEDPARWGHQDESVWTGFVDFLVEAGLIDEAIDVGPAFTNELLEDP